MKALLTLTAAALLSLAALAPAHAEDAKKELTPQQQRMATCNKDAKEQNKTGDDRKAFMKACLGGKTTEPEAKRTPQQEKMAACNKDAKEKNKTGDDRKAFMKECLSAH